MDISFTNPALETAANSSSQLEKLFGPDASRVKQRLYELAAADNLAIVRSIPTLRVRRKAGHAEFTIQVTKTLFIAFKPVLGDAQKTKKALDDSEVTAIQITTLGKTNAP